jgi:hypothetical protein
MRKWVAATLLVASCTLAHAQDSTDTKATADKKKTGVPPTAVETAAVQRARASKDLDRHNEVCLKLRTIATDTNDEALLRKSYELEDRAWAIYQLRTSTITNIDEQILAKRVPTGVAGLRPTGPPLPTVSQSNTAVPEGQR